MFTTFTLLVVVGGAFRFALNRGLKHRWGANLTIPQGLAGALVVLAGLPDLLMPFPYPLPLSIALGVVLSDLILRGKQP